MSKLPKISDLSDAQKKTVVADSLKALVAFHVGVGSILTNLESQFGPDARIDIRKVEYALTQIAIGHALCSDALTDITENAAGPVQNVPTPKGTLLN